MSFRVQQKFWGHNFSKGWMATRSVLARRTRSVGGGWCQVSLWRHADVADICADSRRWHKLQLSRLADVTYSQSDRHKHHHHHHHFWQAALRVRSAERRQSPEWTVLSQVNRVVHIEVAGFQILQNGFHPCNTKTSQWSPPQTCSLKNVKGAVMALPTQKITHCGTFSSEHRIWNLRNARFGEPRGKAKILINRQLPVEKLLLLAPSPIPPLFNQRCCWQKCTISHITRCFIKRTLCCFFS